MLRYLLVLVLLTAGAACSSTPRRYTCRPAAGPIVIDGLPTEPGWRTADWTEPFMDIQGPGHPRPRFATRARLTYDANYLYVAADMEEPHLCATLTEHDAIIWHDNDFEIFLDPDGDGRNYYEIEVNAHNTVFDLLLVRPYRDGGPAQHDWHAAGLRSAVHLEGTLNDPRDADHGWSVELAIPWTTLAEHTSAPCPPRPGDTWRLNMSRVQWTYDINDNGYHKRPGRREDNWVWSPQHMIDMHQPEHWGYLTFK